ncbi:unnamed protein product [Amoebophrya sp. A120]|nr:unnamed protein product [Amoebophrya sp. A120]|eukprot:GSA120T00025149001.1
MKIQFPLSSYMCVDCEWRPGDYLLQVLSICVAPNTEPSARQQPAGQRSQGDDALAGRRDCSSSSCRIFLFDIQQFRQSKLLMEFLEWILASERMYAFAPMNDLAKIAVSFAWWQQPKNLHYAVVDLQPRVSDVSVLARSPSPVSESDSGISVTIVPGEIQHSSASPNHREDETEGAMKTSPASSSSSSHGPRGNENKRSSTVRKARDQLPSLQTRVREELGHEMSKAEQCSDWAQRPLSADQKRYAALDAWYLLQLLFRETEEQEQHVRLGVRRPLLRGVIPTFGPLVLTPKMLQHSIELPSRHGGPEKLNSDNVLVMGRGGAVAPSGTAATSGSFLQKNIQEQTPTITLPEDSSRICRSADYKTLACWGGDHGTQDQDGLRSFKIPSLDENHSSTRQKFLCMLSSCDRLDTKTTGLQLASDVVAEFYQQPGSIGPFSPLEVRMTEEAAAASSDWIESGQNGTSASGGSKHDEVTEDSKLPATDDGGGATGACSAFGISSTSEKEKPPETRRLPPKTTAPLSSNHVCPAVAERRRDIPATTLESDRGSCYTSAGTVQILIDAKLASMYDAFEVPVGHQTGVTRLVSQKVLVEHLGARIVDLTETRCASFGENLENSSCQPPKNTTSSTCSAEDSGDAAEDAGDGGLGKGVMPRCHTEGGKIKKQALSSTAFWSDKFSSLEAYEAAVNSLSDSVRREVRRRPANKKTANYVYFTLKYSADSVYGNCSIIARDGELLTKCDEKKLRWYLQQKLAERVPGEPRTIKLLFDPEGRKHYDEMSFEQLQEQKKADSFHIQEKANICVCCGAERNYVRFKIVPTLYRKHFPEEFKAHSSHDVVLLCVACQERAQQNQYRLIRKLDEADRREEAAAGALLSPSTGASGKTSAPVESGKGMVRSGSARNTTSTGGTTTTTRRACMKINPEELRSLALDTDTHVKKVRSAAAALWGDVGKHRIPEARIRDLKNEILRFCADIRVRTVEAEIRTLQELDWPFFSASERETHERNERRSITPTTISTSKTDFEERTCSMLVDAERLRDPSHDCQGPDCPLLRLLDEAIVCATKSARRNQRYALEEIFTKTLRERGIETSSPAALERTAPGSTKLLNLVRRMCKTAKEAAVKTRTNAPSCKNYAWDARSRSQPVIMSEEGDSPCSQADENTESEKSNTRNWQVAILQQCRRGIARISDEQPKVSLDLLEKVLTWTEKDHGGTALPGKLVWATTKMTSGGSSLRRSTSRSCEEEGSEQQHFYLKINPGQHFSSSSRQLRQKNPVLSQTEIGQRIVEKHVARDTLAGFIRMWREHFLDLEKPKFMPSGWGVANKCTRAFGKHSRFQRRTRNVRDPRSILHADCFQVWDDRKTVSCRETSTVAPAVPNVLLAKCADHGGAKMTLSENVQPFVLAQVPIRDLLDSWVHLFGVRSGNIQDTSWEPGQESLCQVLQSEPHSRNVVRQKDHPPSIPRTTLGSMGKPSAAVVMIGHHADSECNTLCFATLYQHLQNLASADVPPNVAGRTNVRSKRGEDGQESAMVDEDPLRCEAGDLHAALFPVKTSTAPQVEMAVCAKRIVCACRGANYPCAKDNLPMEPTEEGHARVSAVDSQGIKTHDIEHAVRAAAAGATEDEDIGRTPRSDSPTLSPTATAIFVARDGPGSGPQVPETLLQLPVPLQPGDMWAIEVMAWTTTTSRAQSTGEQDLHFNSVPDPRCAPAGQYSSCALSAALPSSSLDHSVYLFCVPPSADVERKLRTIAAEARELNAMRRAMMEACVLPDAREAEPTLEEMVVGDF